jgi:hypothetical protein
VLVHRISRSLWVSRLNRRKNGQMFFQRLCQTPWSIKLLQPRQLPSPTICCRPWR